MWFCQHKPQVTDGDLNAMRGMNIPVDEKDKLYIELLKNRGGKVGLKEVLLFKGNEQVIKNI